MIMREFNEIEKEILRKLVNARKQYNIREVCLATILNEHLDAMAVEWKLEDKHEVTIYCKKEDNPQQQLGYLLDYLCLFKYLEENGLILIHRLKHITEERALYNHKLYYKKGGIYYCKNHGTMNIFDKELIVMSYDKSYTLQLNSDLAEMLEHYVCALIHPTAKLEEYVNQGFKTTQQLQHDCAIHTAWIGIGVSIILGLLGLWCN